LPGIKAILYSLCAVQTPEQSKLFHDLLLRQIETIHSDLRETTSADDFIERVIKVIENFRLFDKTRHNKLDHSLHPARSRFL